MPDEQRWCGDPIRVFLAGQSLRSMFTLIHWSGVAFLADLLRW